MVHFSLWWRWRPIQSLGQLGQIFLCVFFFFWKAFSPPAMLISAHRGLLWGGFPHKMVGLFLLQCSKNFWTPEFLFYVFTPAEGSDFSFICQTGVGLLEVVRPFMFSNRNVWIKLESYSKYVFLVLQLFKLAFFYNSKATWLLITMF